MLYVKHVVMEVKMSTWSRVYYNNGISLLLNLPLIMLCQFTSSDDLWANWVPGPVAGVTASWLALVGWIALSAAGGLRISYAVRESGLNPNSSDVLHM